jgi:Tfp pilus assembly protein PilN
MRAVNLIPTDARKGGGAGAAGRSGGGVYVLLGGLAALVGLVAVWALAGHGINEKKSDLTRLKSETASAQAQAQQLASFNNYSQVRRDRVTTVRSLALSRFNWAKALDAVARTLPDDAWVTSMTGTAAPGVSVEGGGSTASGLRGQRSVPAIELVGCTKSQSKVARLISRLSAVPGVDRVAIADSKKADASGGDDACRGGHASYPQFNVVLFFGNDAPANGPASPNATGAPASGAPPAPASSSANAPGATGTSNGSANGGSAAPATPSTSPASPSAPATSPAAGGTTSGGASR